MNRWARILNVIAMLAMASAAGVAVAGPYDQPYALVETGGDSEVRKESRISISQVDTKSTRNSRKTDPLPPGKHTITVRFESARGTFSPATQDLEMNLEPCVRYRVVAVYEVKTGPDWKPKVYSEPIGECRKKFKLGN